MSNEENIINIDQFMNVDLRVAKIIDAKDVEEADKLLEIRVDIGTEERTIFAGIKGYYDPSDLIGKLIVVVANLKPRKMRFGISEGMLLMTGDESQLYLLSPDSGARGRARRRRRPCRPWCSRCLLYTSPSPRDATLSRMPSSA